VTDEHFPVRDLLSAEASIDAHANSLTQKHDPKKERMDITIKLRIAPEMTYRVFDEFEEGMIEKQTDGSFIITVTYPKDNCVYGYILSFGEYAEVLEPMHLREIINAKAQKIFEKYL
jgi:predicted DNA-binding transcriptional regulator YafY